LGHTTIPQIIAAQLEEVAESMKKSLSSSLKKATLPHIVLGMRLSFW
jgi:hypothetical protein